MWILSFVFSSFSSFLIDMRLTHTSVIPNKSDTQVKLDFPIAVATTDPSLSHRVSRM